jgi:hypothetical protein
MAGRRVQPPAEVRAIAFGAVDDMATNRALGKFSDAVQALQAAALRVVVTQDLAIGTNVVRHGLGRAARGYTLVATVADAAFAHAIDDSNPSPDLEVWISVVGAAQPGARVEVW